MPEILSIFDNAIIVNFQQIAGLAGERIGYIAVSSRIKDADVLINALSFCNRTSFCQCPGAVSKVVAENLNTSVDIEDYKRKRDILWENLSRLGFECIKPQGAFYLFPKALIADDIEFIKRALKYNILLVPGSGFGCPGYFRMSYSIGMDTIVNSIPAFEKLVREFD
jgi:aspartate aminotransferase